MTYTRPSRPVPAARIDPIESYHEALWLFLSTIDARPAAETVVYFLDDSRCGVGVVHVDATSPDDFVGIVDFFASAGAGSDEVAAMIVGSVRPDGGPEYDDLDRWEQAAELCEEAGIELVEWIVLGATSVTCPRELCDATSRWAI